MVIKYLLCDVHVTNESESKYPTDEKNFIINTYVVKCENKLIKKKRKKKKESNSSLIKHKICLVCDVIKNPYDSHRRRHTDNFEELHE